MGKEKRKGVRVGDGPECGKDGAEVIEVRQRGIGG